MIMNESRVTRMMDESGLDALLAVTQPNVFYLTGVWNLRENFALARRDALACPGLVMPLGSVGYGLHARPGVGPILTFGSTYCESGPGDLTEPERLVKSWAERKPLPTAVDALGALIAEMGAGEARLGYDEKGLDPGYVPEIARRFPGLRLVPAFQLFRRIFMVKTPEEVERMAGAVRITEQAITAAMALAREGVSQREMWAEFETTQIRLGATPAICHIGFGHSATFGMINVPEDRLRRGDLIRFDVGCNYRCYASDIARTFALGEPAEQLKRYYRATLVGEQAAIEHVRPGVAASEVFHVAIQAVREAGIPHYLRTLVGHGMGIGISSYGAARYDLPTLGPDDHTILEPGMVLEVETPYYEYGLGGMQVEDTVVVTEDGCRMLTSLDRQLVVLH